MTRSRGTPDPGVRHRPRLTILVKLLIAFAVPTTIIFAIFAYVAHQAARDNLEAELGTRLAAVAGAAATQIRGSHLVDLDIGDEDDRAYLFNKRKLEAIARETGVSRVYVFDPEFRVKVATDPASPVGSEHFYAQLHRTEIERVFSGGATVSTVLFTGNDGKQYLAGYAPVRASENDPAIVLALGVDASPGYFERLASLRRSLVLYGAIVIAIVIAVAVLVAHRLTRPIRSLAGAAERIGRGQLEAPIERSSRDEIGFLAETMDRMRRDLRARDERMQMMLAGVAHEVRNPLGGMKLFTGILKEDLEPGDEKRDHVERLERELGYLDRVVSEFLDYARRPDPELSPIDLSELAAEVVELVAPEAESRGVAVSSQLDPAVVEADPGQLRRVLLNLVRNAIEAAGKDGTVDIEVTGESDAARLRVANSGPPIDPDIADRIFEPFFTTREKGTGLGLAFAHEIALDHGGSLATRREGDRTLFELSLPA